MKWNVNGNGEEMVFVKRLAKNYFSLSNNTFNCKKKMNSSENENAFWSESVVSLYFDITR